MRFQTLKVLVYKYELQVTGIWAAVLSESLKFIACILNEIVTSFHAQKVVFVGVDG
jgi:hypothetical protein